MDEKEGNNLDDSLKFTARTQHKPEIALSEAPGEHPRIPMEMRCSDGTTTEKHQSERVHPSPYALHSDNNRWEQDIDPSLKLAEGHSVIHIAPMLKVTDKHFRAFLRLLSKRVVLWSEMIVDKTLIHTPHLDHHLGFDDTEHPIICQIGGNDPESLETAARIVKSYGYDGINLNVGCPSSRVSGEGCFGASLMNKPELVNRCVRAITRGFGAPASIKTRIGLDHHVGGDWLDERLEIMHKGLLDTQHYRIPLVIHARSAILGKLTPAANRSIPPLNFDEVCRAARKYPHYKVIINGGITDLDEIEKLLHVRRSAESNEPLIHAVMIGRLACNNPCVLADVDRRFHGVKNPESAETRHTLFNSYVKYLERAYRADSHQSLFMYIRPLLELFHGMDGCSAYKKYFNEISHRKDLTPIEGVEKLVAYMEEHYPASLNSPIVSS